MQWSASPHDRDHVFGKARAVFRTLEICRLAIKTSVWIQLPIEEACKYFGATASGSSLDDADVTDAFENNHYWKYRYEFMEDDHLNFLLLLFHLYRCKSFLSEAKDIWKLLGGKPSVRKDPAKRMQRRAYIKTKVSSKPSQ